MPKKAQFVGKHKQAITNSTKLVPEMGQTSLCKIALPLLGSSLRYSNTLLKMISKVSPLKAVTSIITEI